MNRPLEVPDLYQRPARFSVAEYSRMLEAGMFEDMRVELVEGELVRMSPSHSEHGRAHAQVFGRLFAILREAGLESAIDIAAVTAPRTVRGPDIAVLRPDAPRRGLAEAQHLLLAIEIADSSIDRDLHEKARDYGGAGIPHYWVIDLAHAKTHVFSEAAAHGYDRSETVPFDQPIPVPGTGSSLIIG
jgi:Uma2 family endonuclease